MCKDVGTHLVDIQTEVHLQYRHYFIVVHYYGDIGIVVNETGCQCLLLEYPKCNVS